MNTPVIALAAFFALCCFLLLLLLLLLRIILRARMDSCIGELVPLITEIFNEEAWLTISDLQIALAKKGCRMGDLSLFLTVQGLFEKKILQIYDESNRVKFTGIVASKSLWLRLYADS